jgi:hypothetical protein
MSEDAPGQIHARFRHGRRSDHIVLRLRMQGERIITTPHEERYQADKFCNWTRTRRDFSVYMESVNCPFDEFIYFLQGMAVQVKECAFEWDPEGPWARMSWIRRFPHQDGYLTVAWIGRHEDKFSYEMRLNTRQAVRMLYTAFRRFVESDDYDPIRYEELKAGEAFELILTDTSLAGLAAYLAGSDVDAARKLIQTLQVSVFKRSCNYASHRHSLGHFRHLAELRGEQGDTEAQWISPEWQGWSRNERLRDVFENIFTSGLMCNWGRNLRTLRSPLIEEWLSSPDGEGK